MCCQVYSHKVGFTACYLQLNEKGDSLGKSIDDFLHDFGDSEHLTFDGFNSKVGKNTRFYTNLCKYSVNHHVSVPRCQNENPSEGATREIKHRFYRIMKKKRVLKRYW